MATGFRWVRVQLPERLHRQASKRKGPVSWDHLIEEALVAWLESRREAANDTMKETESILKRRTELSPSHEQARAGTDQVTTPNPRR